MKVRNIAQALILSTGSILSGCNTNSSKLQSIYNPKYVQDKVFTEIAADTFSRKISDREKIIIFNKLQKKYNEPVSNYIIVDKKQCTATVYNPEGKVLNVEEVAVGRDIGDKRCGGYKVKGAKLRAYTPAGEESLLFQGKAVRIQLIPNYTGKEF